MAHLEFGQDRLAQPHPLQALELAQRPVERPLEVQSTTPSAPAVELTIYITNMISNSYIGQISHDDYPTRESHNRRSTHNPYASCNIHAATPQVRTPRLGMLSEQFPSAAQTPLGLLAPPSLFTAHPEYDV